jgi:BirA family biotin operon repressor/biotin-[acetyl-CoA-carboxylase] ligase
MHGLPKNIEIAIIKAYVDQKYHKYLQPENIACFTELPSTNSYLLECANKKNNALMFCLAEKQTAGRGRRNRIWESPDGNIYLSILWSFDYERSQLSGLSLAIAIAVNRAFNKYGVKGTNLKWPNDILYHGYKLAGILIETTPKINNSGTAVVIGIGVNINLSTIKEKINAIDIISIIKHTADRNLLIGLLINAVLEIILIFQTKGLTPFIDEWQAQDYSYQQMVTIHYQDQIIEGINRGISQSGHLLLEITLNNHAKKLYCIAAGEVSLRKIT